MAAFCAFICQQFTAIDRERRAQARAARGAAATGAARHHETGILLIQADGGYLTDRLPGTTVLSNKELLRNRLTMSNKNITTSCVFYCHVRNGVVIFTVASVCLCVRVCVYVCVSVCSALTFESLDLESAFWYAGTSFERRLLQFDLSI